MYPLVPTLLHRPKCGDRPDTGRYTDTLTSTTRDGTTSPQSDDEHIGEASEEYAKLHADTQSAFWEAPPYWCQSDDVEFQRRVMAKAGSRGWQSEEAYLKTDESIQAYPIIDVWADNFEAEMANMRRAVSQCRYIAIDTEYPGFVIARSCRKATQEERNYDNLRRNVDVIKLIQLGVCCKNMNGYSGDACCWQFHFEFDRDRDAQCDKSMRLLTHACVNWDMHKYHGINLDDFAIQFTKIFVEGEAFGTNRRGPIRYISFHGMYDFGFLVKLVTRCPLPDTLEEFLDVLAAYFPYCCDLKFSLSFHGSLDHLASVYNISRVGTAHQAGSDALTTSAIFFSLPLNVQQNIVAHGVLFGLHKELPGIVASDSNAGHAANQLRSQRNDPMEMATACPPKDSNDNSAPIQRYKAALEAKGEKLQQQLNFSKGGVANVQQYKASLEAKGGVQKKQINWKQDAQPVRSKFDPHAPPFQPRWLSATPNSTEPTTDSDLVDAPPKTSAQNWLMSAVRKKQVQVCELQRERSLLASQWFSPELCHLRDTGLCESAAKLPLRPDAEHWTGAERDSAQLREIWWRGFGSFCD